MHASDACEAAGCRANLRTSGGMESVSRRVAGTAAVRSRVLALVTADAEVAVAVKREEEIRK